MSLKDIEKFIISLRKELRKEISDISIDVDCYNVEKYSCLFVLILNEFHERLRNYNKYLNQYLDSHMLFTEEEISDIKGMIEKEEEILEKLEECVNLMLNYCKNKNCNKIRI